MHDLIPKLKGVAPHAISTGRETARPAPSSCHERRPDMQAAVYPGYSIWAAFSVRHGGAEGRFTCITSGHSD